MRVTQKTMYDSMLNGMNKNLSDYMESISQGSTQKRINKPSDDPAGTARILSYRSSLQRTESYVDNAKNAQEWLAQASGAIDNLSTTIIRIKSLAEQASTETYSPEQRMAIGQEIRQLFGSILNLSNTEYGGKHIFAGQKYDESAYEEGLNVSADRLGENPNGSNWFNPPAQVTGALDYTAIVRFSRDGQVPPAAGEGPMEYQWSTDGGETWVSGQIAENATYFDVGGARISIPQHYDAAGNLIPNDNTMTVKQGYDDPSDPMGLREGTSFFVRPTAIYQGSDNNSEPTISHYGSVTIPPEVGTSATGAFKDNVLVRLDSGVDWTNPANPLSYSYSTDGGRTWTGGNTATIDTTAAPNTARLVVPNGFVDISAGANLADSEIPAGAQLIVQPQRTNLDFEIMPGQTVTVNNVGKDVFGGLYQTNGDPNYKAMFGEGDGRNLFETVGRLIGYCETNDTDGIARALDELTEAHTTVLAYDASVGGKINRLEVTLSTLDTNKYNTQDAISSVEDIDLTTLMINLTKQQMAYSTVLKSSSMIMGLNLTNYL